VPVSDPYDQLERACQPRRARGPAPAERRPDRRLRRAGREGKISSPLNWGSSPSDSRFPELAGLRGAAIGTFYLLLTTFAIAFPVGIGAAIYLEEFAPKNRLSDFIEVNINNLAAVPSVVFGLLALAVFLNWFGLPRGRPSSAA
jgi:phosphate transport system permease protein